MAPPPIQLFLTTIASQITLRQRQEYILRVLQVKKIEFTSYDLASDEQAKRLWKRKAPADKQQLPGILVGGEFPGDFTQFEEAVEFNELDIFLRRNEDFKPFEDEKNLLRAEPIGVPGAYSPLQMYPNHAPSRSPSPSPLALREKEKKEVNAGEELAEFGLANVSVSEDDLRALVAELGLGGDEADDLVKGLSGPAEATPAAKETKPAPEPKPKEKKPTAQPKETKPTPKPTETQPLSKPKEIEPTSASKESKPVSEPKAEEVPTKEEEPLEIIVKTGDEKEEKPPKVIVKEGDEKEEPKAVEDKESNVVPATAEAPAPEEIAKKE